MNSRRKNRRNPSSTSTKLNRIKQLHEIREDALATSNPYKLSDKEHDDLVVVLNTLDYITENSKELSKRKGHARTAFFISKDPKKHAPIHLDNYPAGDDGEKIMLGSLVDLFITSFENVKKLHPTYVKEFCSKLYGDCIDIRTKPAFDYALTIGKIPSFTERMKIVSDLINKESEDPLYKVTEYSSYFNYFAIIYAQFWGKPYAKDSTKPGYSEQDGIFDETSFPLIARFLSDLGLKPDSSIFNTLSLTPNLGLSKFWILNFALFHDSFFDELGLKDRSQEDISADCKNIKDPYLQTVYDNCLIGIEIKKENGFDLSSEKQFQILINLLNRCGHKCFFNILDRNNVFKLLSLDQKKYLLEICIKRLEKCKNNPRFVREILTLDLTDANQSIFYIAVEVKNISAVKKLLLLAPQEYELQSPPLEKAIKDESWDIIEIFAELNIGKRKSHNFLAYCLIALSFAIEKQKIAIIYKLLALIPSKHIGTSTLTNALESNNISLCEVILKSTTHISKINIFIIELYNKKIKDSTLNWILSQEKMISFLANEQHNNLIETMIQECTDIEKLKIFISKPYLNIGLADKALSTIDGKPNAEKIKELFSSTEMKYRMAYDKVHFHKDYQYAINIISDIYSEKADTEPFDFIKILKLNELNPYQQKLLASLFLTKNFELIRSKKDRALFEALEKYVSTETITAEMRAAFPKAEPAATAATSVAANPASFLYHGPARENKRTNPPEVLADDDNVQKPEAKKVKRSQKSLARNPM